MPRNVILYGGSFDPPHNGHAMVATAVYDRMNATSSEPFELWFLPNYTDSVKQLSPVNHRLEMLKLMVYGHIARPNFSVCTYEIDMANSAGTYAVVKSLQKSYPGVKFWYLIGYDQALSIRTWRNSRKLLKTVPFIVINRPRTYNHYGYVWWKSSPHVFIPGHVSPETISSTDIRKAFSSNHTRRQIRNTHGGHYRLTTEVTEYILENELYKPVEDDAILSGSWQTATPGWFTAKGKST